MKKLFIFWFAFATITLSAQVQFGNVQKLATVTATGTITTQNLVPTGVATAGSAVEVTLLGSSTLSIQTTGTYTGALSVQVTVDGINWITFGGTQIINANLPNTGLATITSALQGIFQTEVGGYVKARVTGLAAMTGTATITIVGIQNPSIVDLGSSIPSGTNAIGSVSVSSGTITPFTTPTATTTGDTGAKTATFNGATVTNATSKGALIVFNVGAVSGTTPTMVCKLQESADTGTTWVDVPTATTATLTATGVYGIKIYPSITAVAGTTTTGTTAQVSSTLATRWRVVYTIGGTTPSFTLTNVQVSYLF